MQICNVRSQGRCRIAGEREKALRQRLQRIRRDMPDPTPELEAAPQDSVQPTGPPEPIGAATLPSAEIPLTPDKPEGDGAAPAEQQDTAMVDAG